MRVYHEVIAVEPSKGMPRTIQWRQKCFQVMKLLDYWVAEGKWWSGGERRNYLLLITNRGTLEIFQYRDDWYLSRVYD